MRKDVKNNTAPVRRRHVWQPFSVQIERVQIDVARKIKRNDSIEEETESYFVSGLQKWSELNLTIPFTQFLQEVDKTARSLPQVLYHQVDILQALLKAIARQDSLSLNALLDLLVQFIRDLQADFEPHVPLTISTLVPVTKVADVEVIEATFTTFAYLFKYLQKPLAANPQPIYDAFAPMLARDSKQRSHIVRFAAESLAFLLRRTRAQVQQELLIHVFADVASIDRAEYTEGVSFLLFEAIRGVDHSIHAKGLSLLQLTLLMDNADTNAQILHHLYSVIENVTISLLHHCTADSFQPILSMYIGKAACNDLQKRSFGWRLCFISCAVRKGTRIQQWRPLLALLQNSLKDSSEGDLSDAISLASVLFTYAPHEDIISSAASITSLLAKNNSKNVLIISSILVRQNAKSFSTFLLPLYRSCIITNWNAQTRDGIVQASLALAEHGAFAEDSTATIDGRLRLSDGILQDCLQCLDESVPSTANQGQLHATIKFLALIAPMSAIADTVWRFLNRCLVARTSEFQTRKLATLLGTVIGILSSTTDTSQDLVQRLQGHLGLWSCSHLLEGFSKYAIRQHIDALPESIKAVLVNNLSLPGHSRRLFSIRILQQTMSGLSEVHQDLMSVCEIIESTELTFEATRSLEMQIRKIDQNYGRLTDSGTKLAISKYMLGLLTTNHTPLWSYCSATLAIIAQTEPDMVWGLAREWFLNETPSLSAPPVEAMNAIVELVPQAPEAALDAFRCFNTTELRQNCLDAQFAVHHPLSMFDSAYCQAARLTEEDSRVSRRSQAIRIFSAISGIAEQHSRELVPVFLAQFETLSEDEDIEDSTSDVELEDTIPADDEAEEEGGLTLQRNRSHTRLDKKERNDLLILFSKFQNPAAFFESQRVRQVVMKLLASRDSRTQNLAFEILLHYRDAHLKPYEDNLKNMLSDTRSRDEITTFLQTDAGESQIEDTDRRFIMPVISRILYGRMINRRHAGSQKKGLTNTRNIVLGAIASLPEHDIADFLEVFLIGFKQLPFIKKDEPQYKVDEAVTLNLLTARRQIGFCTMMQDALVQLAGKVLPFVSEILDALIYCFLSASDILEHSMDTEENKISIKIARNVRHHAYQALDLLFTHCRSFKWSPYMNIIFEHFVNPRIDKLPQESSQSPSGLLKLLGNWASSATTSPLLVQFNDQLLIKIFDILSENTVKDDVSKFVLNIVNNIYAQVTDPTCPFSELTRKALLEDKIGYFLHRMLDLLERQKFASSNNTITSDFLELEISVLSSISTLVTGGPSVQVLLDLLIPLLLKPRKVVAENVKDGILIIIRNLLPLSPDYIDEAPSLWTKYHSLISLFGSCSTRHGRDSLSAILQCFAQKDSALAYAATLVTELNSYSVRRLDTPDFDRRLAAFADLNESQYSKLSPKAWRPVLYNMIYFIGDEEELALRTNATYSIRRFLEGTRDSQGTSAGESFTSILEQDLYPAMKKGLRRPQELIRQEWVGILGITVKQCSFWHHVSDLVPLLVDGDEEANFFYNIMHIQQHRRLRALRRLATISQQHELRSENIAQVLLPLIEHYCFAPKEESHNLIAQTISTIGQLAASMKYTQFCALLKRYIGLLKPQETGQMTVVRLIDVVVNALVQDLKVSTSLVDYLHEEESPIESEAEIGTKDNPSTEQSVKQPLLLQTKPVSEKYEAMVSNNFLPHLTKYLHSKDDETVSLRIPIAFTVVKLLASLPQESLKMKLPGVLTDVCHILRSRSQDARDMTRKTLGSIACVLGPKYFSYILTELKAALQRGYQLHVLGFSVHTILSELSPEYGSLDYCLDQLVDVLIDDIFGETGLEKDAEAYVAKMKEMKSTRSYASFEMLAGTCQLSSLGGIIVPLKNLLASTSSLKTLRKVDEVLRRLSLGILQNESCAKRDSLLLCFNLYQQALESTQDRPAKLLSIGEEARLEAEKNFLVDLKARKSYVQNHTKANAHRLIKFSLETLRSVLQKHPALQTAENLAAFISLIGDALMSGYEDVHIAALRVLTQIIKIDLRSLDSGAPVFLEQAVKFIKASPSTKTELCQAALKFLAAILKERKQVVIKDSVLSYLLLRIKGDIEEPDRQGVTFTILRSIMSRKFKVPELYDVMEDIATMMVTNQSAGPRDTARSAYFQFLLEYPQGKLRLEKQMAFMIKNLEYVHSSGRKSVMEVLSLIITRFDDSLLQDFIMMLYFACTMSMINDDDAGCREMSAALLKKLIERANKENVSSISGALRSWAYSDELLLQRASLQGFGILFEVHSQRSEDVKFFLEKFSKVLALGVSLQHATEDEEDESQDDQSMTWQILYYSMQTFTRILADKHDTYITSKYASLWSNVQKLLLYRHAWIRLMTSRLVGVLFANRIASATGSFVTGRDLVLQDIDLVRIARHLLIQMRSPLLSEELGKQITKNLIFLLRCFEEQKTLLPPKEDDDDVDHDTDDKPAISCVEWLLHRVATLLQSDRDVKRETHLLVRRLLLQCFAASINILPIETLIVHGTSIAKPIYKYAEIETHTNAQSEIKDLAVEVFELFKNKIGQTKFAEVYNTVRQAQLAVRQDRKQKRTIENVKFPERGAQKKIKSSLKKREKRMELAQHHKQRRERGITNKRA